MALRFNNGLLLFSDAGLLAMDAACCCDEAACVDVLPVVHAAGWTVKVNISYEACASGSAHNPCEDLSTLHTDFVLSPIGTGPTYTWQQINANQYGCSERGTYGNGTVNVFASCQPLTDLVSISGVGNGIVVPPSAIANSSIISVPVPTRTGAYVCQESANVLLQWVAP